jgi:nicotinate-nucleotide adenylyltransferase
LRHYRRDHDDALFLIIGADSLKDFPSWKEPEEILRLATLVVYPRTGYPAGVELEGNAPIVLNDAPIIDVSSSDVRQRLEAGRSVERWLPGAVHDFIKKNKLYGD